MLADNKTAIMERNAACLVVQRRPIRLLQPRAAQFRYLALSGIPAERYGLEGAYVAGVGQRTYMPRSLS